ncbi:MAG: thioredoxin 2 [Miltoncostaeaceae bacterium]|jgi:thioredoxin 2|nr:thioredoxin 2 [Miltoncostaeaceae bacterium]
MASTVVTCPNCGTRNRLRAHPTAVPRCASCKNPLPWLVDADEATFDDEIRASVPVVVDFWAPWCGPCRMVAPVLERMTARHAGRLKVVRVNVDEAPALAARYQALSIPTLVVIVDAAEVDRVVGALPQPALEARLAPHLAAAHG